MRYSFRIKRTLNSFNIIIPENFKVLFKSIKIIITFCGLFSAYMVFGSVHIAFIFGLILFVISWFIEKINYLYNVLYIHPQPNFQLYPEKWTGCVFGKIEAQDKSFEIPLVGALYDDIKYAKKIHSLLLKWSNGEYNDSKKNVLLSVILDGDSYYFFIYPNYENEFAQKELSYFKAYIKKIDKNGIAEFQYLTFILGRRFDITNKSYFPVFREKYQEGIPFIYMFYFAHEVDKPETIVELKEFKFYNLKIKERKELTQKDIEYSVLKLLE